jgi:hypothetical protein
MEIFTINTSHQNIPYPTKGSVVLRTPIFIQDAREVWLPGDEYSRESAHVEIFHPYLAEYILDMAECEEACLGISSGSHFLFGDSQGNLFSSDSIPLDQVASYEAFSHIQPSLARVYFI